MFFPVTHYSPQTFVPPTITSLSASGDFFLGSFPKGPGEKIILEKFSQAGIAFQLIPDPHRVWSNFNNYQLFAFGFTLSQDFVHRLLCEEGAEVSPALLGKGFMAGSLAVTPCSPDNNLRIVRMATLEGFGKIENRSGPIALLQSLRLVDQVFPLTNFHFKVQKSPGVSDESLVAALALFDLGFDRDRLHSVFTGGSTLLVHPPPSPPPSPDVPFRLARTFSALVLDRPPLRLSVKDALEWGAQLGLHECGAYLGSGPTGTILVLEFISPFSFEAPKKATFFGQAYKVRFLHEAPHCIARVVWDEKRVLSSLRDVFVDEPCSLPVAAGDQVRFLLEDPSYLALFSSPAVTPPPPPPHTPLPTPSNNFLGESVLSSASDCQEEKDIAVLPGPVSSDASSASVAPEVVSPVVLPTSAPVGVGLPCGDPPGSPLVSGVGDQDLFSPGIKRPRDAGTEAVNLTPPDQKKVERVLAPHLSPHSISDSPS